MLYTLISACVILIILFLLTLLNKKKSLVVNDFSYLSLNHTNILKGIAAIMIVVSHIANYKGLNILIPMGGVGVALFLIISGFGLNESFKKKGLHNFFKNRLLKIIIPYWIMVVVYGFINSDVITFYSFLGSFMLINRLPFMWFIQYIIIWYLVFYLSKKLFDDMQGLLFLITVGLLSLYIFKDNVWGEQSLSFTLGVIISQIKIIKEYLQNNAYKFLFISFLMVITSCSLVLYVKINGMDTIGNYLIINIIQMYMKITLAIFIIQITYTIDNFLYAGLITAGIYSFEIYLAHTLVIEKIKDNQLYYLIYFFIIFIFIAFLIKKISSRVFVLIFERK